MYLRSIFLLAIAAPCPAADTAEQLHPGMVTRSKTQEVRSETMTWLGTVLVSCTLAGQVFAEDTTVSPAQHAAVTNQAVMQGGDTVAREPEWSETVGGLQYRLYVAPHDPAKTKAVDALTFEIRNVTDKPIEIETFNRKTPCLDVRITGYRELRTPPVFAKVRLEPLALQPGKTWTCKVSGGYLIAYGRTGGGDLHNNGWVKFNPAGKTYELSIRGSSKRTPGALLTARITLPARPEPAVYWPPTGKPAPLSTPWSLPTEEGLQTRIAAHAKSFVLGESIPMRVELQHKELKSWGIATGGGFYRGTITVSDVTGKQVGRRTAILDFNTFLREKEIRVVALFDLSHAEYGIDKPGKYSARFDGVPKKPNLVALPASEAFQFEVRGSQK